MTPTGRGAPSRRRSLTAALVVLSLVVGLAGATVAVAHPQLDRSDPELRVVPGTDRILLGWPSVGGQPYQPYPTGAPLTTPTPATAAAAARTPGANPPPTDRPTTFGAVPSPPPPTDAPPRPDPSQPEPAPIVAAGLADPALDTIRDAAGRPIVGIAPAGGSQIVPGSVDRSSLDLTATYAVDAHLAWSTRQLTARTRIDIENTSGQAIDRLELNTIAARLGGIAIDEVTIDGRPRTATVDGQTLVLPLGGILPTGGKVRVVVAYRATLRSGAGGSDWLFTRTNSVAALYRWIPWVSERVVFDRPNHGDPFVTPTSPLVEVTFASDIPLVVAATGIEEAVEDGGRRHVFRATNVREFAITAATDYGVSRATVEGVQIIVMARPGQPAGSLRNEAVKAIERFTPLLGPYPWSHLTVAQTGGGYAMEAPGLIWIPAGGGSLPYLVHHEIAHQWFYGLVGNHQPNEPYADEAITDMVSRYVLGLRRNSSCGTQRLDGTIYEYSLACYYEVVYVQGGNFLDDLRKRVGTSVFFAGVRAYIEANRHAFGGTKELLDAIDAAAAADLVPTYRPRFTRFY
jgi:hypothetical protein